jgi:uncharacterized protein
MSVYKKVQAVGKLFNQLEKDVATFQQATGLGCRSGCGLCCKKPDIHATILEFLPLAYHLYKTGEAEKWFDYLQSDSSDSICHALTPFLTKDSGGFCSQYQHRGLICRVFGFSASLDKRGKAQLVTCKIIKEDFPEAVSKATEHIASKNTTPIISNYYHQLRSIDPDLGSQLLPINTAILESLKTVLGYYSYRNPRKAS